MLVVNKLTKSYNKKKPAVLDDLTIQFDNTGITTIIGLNGCGKTTFLNVLTCIHGFEEGKITLNDFDITTNEYKKEIFYIPSDFMLPDYLSGQEYADFVFQIYPKKHLENFQKLLNFFHLSDSKDKLICEYSFGMKKKLQLAVAFALEVKYVIGDEMLSGLDLEHQMLVIGLLQKFSQHRKFIIVSHDVAFCTKYSDEVLLMEKGKLLRIATTEIEQKIMSKLGYDDVYEQIQSI